MFVVKQQKRSRLSAAYEIAVLIYHSAAREARGTQANAFFGLVLNILMSMVFVVAIYITMTLLGARTSAFRGDFVVFLMAGVMSYMTYNKTMSAVYGAAGPTSAMMLHAPMTTAVAIASSAISALYQQILTSIVMLGGYHVAFKPVEINDPSYAFFMMLAAWAFGIGSGMVLLAIKPWLPKIAPLLMMIVKRVNVFASGKMMVGNMMSFTLLKFFDWNPLFHTIDQMRGAIFINYVPRNSSTEYALTITFALIAIGLMGEFFSRQHASASWGKR